MMAFEYMQGYELLYLINSPFFVPLVVFIIIFTPLGIFGMINLYYRIRNWNRTRSGWIKVRKKLSNLHWIEFWAKPTGRKTNIKTEEGIEIELPLEITEGMIGMEKEVESNF